MRSGHSGGFIYPRCLSQYLNLSRRFDHADFTKNVRRIHRFDTGQTHVLEPADDPWIVAADPAPCHARVDQGTLKTPRGGRRQSVGMRPGAGRPFLFQRG